MFDFDGIAPLHNVGTLPIDPLAHQHSVTTKEMFLFSPQIGPGDTDPPIPPR